MQNKWSHLKQGKAGRLHLYLARLTFQAKNKLLSPLALLLCVLIAFTPVYAKYQMENLSRSLVAVNTGSGNVYIGWRYLGTDPTNIAFNVYRNNTLINSSPVTSSTNFVDSSGSSSAQYTVREVINGVESGASESTAVWNSQYISVNLQRPSGGKTPDGVSYDYSPNDLSVADLDGDSEYEIIVKWDPSNSKDNSQSGYTGNVYLDAYEMNGTLLWRIDLGRNIRAGAHYTQFIAYDLDGDGRAEVACKTADATIDGKGTVIGDKNADYRNSKGYILSGPEYLTVFDGKSGRALATTDYVPARGKVSSWGDSYGNRVDRFLAGVAYLDGEHPSLIMSRGYYTRAVIAAWDWRNGSLTNRWTFDSNNSGNGAAAKQGAHSLTIGDVDQDGRQEIVYGAATIDDNGSLLYSTGLCHGDALHLGDFNPDWDGLEVFMVHETPSCYGKNAIEMHDARTGSILWSNSGNSGDIGRGLTADIDPRYRGSEAWASSGGMNSATGQKLSSSRPSINFAIWWDADPLREILDKTVINKWNVDESSTDRLLTSYYYGTASNNSTKANPGLTADLFGDWREEVIWRHSNNKQLLIFTTTDFTDMRQFTLMHDPQYRVAVAWQNSGYNQPPHPGFYLGDGMTTPPQPDIYVVGGSKYPVDPVDPNNSAGVTIEENTTGYCGVDGLIERNNAGFMGDGFVNTNNEISSGVDWEISVPDNGSYTLSWRYANGESTDRSAQVIVDGSSVVSRVSFKGTGLWTSWSSASTDVTLNAGIHRVRLESTMSEGLANIDNLTIGGNNPQAADCNNNPDQPDTSLTPASTQISTPSPDQEVPGGVGATTP
jgi:rhamnogalacturonan endolyase